MTIGVDRDALLGALRSVVDVVEGRTTIPILANLLIEAGDGGMTIAGTNLDIQASARIEAAGALATTVDATKMLAAVQSLKPGLLTIAAVEGRSAVTLSAGRGKRTLSTLPTQDFPRMQPAATAVEFDMPATSLARLFDTCHVAQSTEETCYYLCGVFLHVRHEAIVGVATDGHRCVRCAVPLPHNAAMMPDVIVPTKVVAHARKLLAKANGDVGLRITERLIEMRIGGARIVAKLVDGTYPDYSRVIPSDAPRGLDVGRDALIECVRAVAAVVSAEGDQKVRTVRVDLTDGGMQTISAADTTGASAVEDLEGDHHGGALTVGVNHNYLASIAGIFADGSRVSIGFDTPTSPMRVTGDKDPDLVAVIMPMLV